jgi:hypothetical protein
MGRQLETPYDPGSSLLIGLKILNLWSRMSSQNLNWADNQSRGVGQDSRGCSSELLTVVEGQTSDRITDLPTWKPATNPSRRLLLATFIEARL